MTVYEPKPSGLPYGLHVPYNQGYDARSRASAPTAEQKGASGYLQRANGDQIDLWITEVAADFSLSGTSGQSRMLREFFAHSFNDVTLQITGNVASTQEYNRLALFVREHHWNALRYINQGGTASQTMVFGLHDNTPSAWAPGPRGQRNVKGGHRPWMVSGYVQTIAAGATALEVAPEFSLAFIVAESTLTGNTGLWGDSIDGGQTNKTILQLFADAKHHGAGFVKDPISPPTPNPAPQTRPVVPNPDENQATWSVTAVTTIL